MGVVDAAQHFHTVAMAVCYAEQTADFEWVWTELERTLKELDPTYDPATRPLASLYTMQDAAGSIREGQAKVGLWSHHVC